MMEVFSYGIGTLIALAIFLALAFIFISDITQKKHGVLRNFPVVGHLRYFFEEMGEYFRQYFFSGDREEMPFNRATRAWVYRLAKNEGGTIGFGSTYDLHQPGALIFVNHPFPVLEEERLPTPSLALGEGYCKEPFTARSIVNVSGMSFGAISAPAVRSLSRGAAVAGCWMDTGEGGLSPYHLEGGCDLVMQIGTAKYGVRDAQGNQTDYTYAAAHGGILTEIKPAPTPGSARPLTVYTYAQRSAWIKNAANALVQSPDPVWLPATKTECQTTAGSNSPTCDPGQQQTVTTFEYGASGTSEALLVKGVAVSSAGDTLRTCNTYDAYHRRISQTQPNASLGACP